MSLIGYQTQVLNSQCLGDDTRVALVHTRDITHRQRDLMSHCAQSLEHMFNSKAIVYPIQEDELRAERSPLRCFVIPSLSDAVVAAVTRRFEKTRIFLPKAIIETRSFGVETLPVGRLIVSLSMFKCRVFLVKECNLDQHKQPIIRMGGAIAKRLEDANVVVTDRADRRLKKAHERGLPLVSTDWIAATYALALSEDDEHMYHDAMSTIADFQIKSFHGLAFRIAPSVEQKDRVKKLITDNGGKLCYGNNEAHAICVRNENVDHLLLCIKLGFYSTSKELKENSTSSKRLNDLFTRMLEKSNEDNLPQIATQLPSDAHLYFERNPEPSQVIFWQDRN